MDNKTIGDIIFPSFVPRINQNEFNGFKCFGHIMPIKRNINDNEKVAHPAKKFSLKTNQSVTKKRKNENVNAKALFEPRSSSIFLRK